MEMGQRDFSDEDRPAVGIIMGSDSDLPVMEEVFQVLDEFGVAFEARILSAHRTPEEAADYAKTAEKRGLMVIIAGAGWAAHLAGVMAAETIIPVIGVPIDSSPLKGMDSLLSTVQMPPGVPVATMAIGKGGARNAALFAIQILALGSQRLNDELSDFKLRMALEIITNKQMKLDKYLAGRKAKNE